MTDLRESHRMQGSSNRKSPQVGDLVAVSDEGIKRGSWKLAVVEKLITGKDEEVSGAIVRVLTKGKQVRMSRPVQRLFPLEVRAASLEDTPRVNEGGAAETRRDRSRRAAVLDAAWRTKGMLLSSEHD